ncbi:MAG TPA: hypothetical protein VFA33_19445 [Bryobacteraceae bacterium]|nr:hypothetical protein [Bryobacteraceae bacterium]
MRYVRACVVTFLALTGATAAAEGKDGRSSTAPITVYTSFENDPASQVFRALQAELAAIMEPAGVAIDWRELKGVTGHDVVVELVVVTFKGTCAAREAPLPVTSRRRRLGWTHLTDGQVLPFSGVDCDVVQRFISRAMRGAPREEQDRLLGRALARVAAHEMYHVFAGTQKHASSGVGTSLYTAAHLLRDSLRFGEKEIRAMQRGRLRPLFRQNPPQVASAGGGP